jgi:hypothetical protein
MRVQPSKALNRSGLGQVKKRDHRVIVTPTYYANPRYLALFLKLVSGFISCFCIRKNSAVFLGLSFWIWKILDIIGRITSNKTRRIGHNRGFWRKRVLEKVSKAGINSIKVNKSIRSVRSITVSFAQVEYIIFDIRFETTVINISISYKGISVDQEAVVELEERLSTLDNSFRIALFNS